VLGLLILWRAGLVPFGQALFFAAGAYTVALASGRGLSDALLLVALGAAAAAALAWLTGLLLARYREIFFAMLSLALSMILYGALLNSAALGSSDGLRVRPATFFGVALHGAEYGRALFWLALGVMLASALAAKRYLASVAGSLGVPVADNELRVEYLGISVRALVHIKLVIAGALAGAGGGLVALSIAHVDPTVAYWTTSGGFVFVTILAGTVSVWGAFLGAFLFELARTYALAALPGAWQFILGTALLLTIIFIPGGIGSVVLRRRARR
jgi:branched-chain amino acid transport system permease protein